SSAHCPVPSSYFPPKLPASAFDSYPEWTTAYGIRFSSPAPEWTETLPPPDVLFSESGQNHCLPRRSFSWSSAAGSPPHPAGRLPPSDHPYGNKTFRQGEPACCLSSHR